MSRSPHTLTSHPSSQQQSKRPLGSPRPALCYSTQQKGHCPSAKIATALVKRMTAWCNRAVLSGHRGSSYKSECLHCKTQEIITQCRWAPGGIDILQGALQTGLEKQFPLSAYPNSWISQVVLTVCVLRLWCRQETSSLHLSRYMWCSL